MSGIRSAESRSRRDRRLQSLTLSVWGRRIVEKSSVVAGEPNQCDDPIAHALLIQRLQDQLRHVERRLVTILSPNCALAVSVERALGFPFLHTSQGSRALDFQLLIIAAARIGRGRQESIFERLPGVCCHRGKSTTQRAS
jgi:hypothetical protein